MVVAEPTAGTLRDNEPSRGQAAATSDREADPSPRRRSALRAVALPTEHGGWSLTIEPVILGLVVAWSWAGLALGLAAVVAFLARTPLKVVLVDRWRHRWLDRTRLAAWLAAAEIGVLVALVALAAASASDAFWVPLVLAAPLVAVQLWFDARSRSRRIVPEVCGTIGMGAIATAIALAGGADTALAYGLWAVVAARSTAAIVHVRTQVFRLHGRPHRRWHSDLAQVAALAAVGVGWALDAVPLAAVAAIGVVAAVNVIGVRRPPSRPVVLGLQQMVLGIAVVAVTGTAVLVAA